MKDLAQQYRVTPENIPLGAIRPVNRSAMPADTPLNSKKATKAVTNAIASSNLHPSEANYLLDCFTRAVGSMGNMTSTDLRKKIANGGSIFTQSEIDEDKTLKADEKLLRKLVFSTTMQI